MPTPDNPPVQALRGICNSAPKFASEFASEFASDSDSDSEGLGSLQIALCRCVCAARAGGLQRAGLTQPRRPPLRKSCLSGPESPGRFEAPALPTDIQPGNSAAEAAGRNIVPYIMYGRGYSLHVRNHQCIVLTCTIFCRLSNNFSQPAGAPHIHLYSQGFTRAGERSAALLDGTALTAMKESRSERHR